MGSRLPVRLLSKRYRNAKMRRIYQREKPLEAKLEENEKVVDLLSGRLAILAGTVPVN
jgi:hypothetical protein